MSQGYLTSTLFLVYTNSITKKEMKILLASVIALSSVTPALAHHQQHGYSETTTCYREEYREEYVPGTESNPGYIKSWKDTIEYPCSRTRTTRTSENTTRTRVYEEYDENDCTDGKIAGALLGGGAGAAMSRGDGRWWAIPLGAVVGSAIGCDAAGG